MTVCHNSHNLAFRSPFGAVRAGETVSLTLEAAVTDGITGCDLILRRDGEKEERIPMERNLVDKLRFFVKIKTPSEGALLWYYFILTDSRGNTLYYGNNAEGYGGSGRLSESEPIPYQITVYEVSAAPEWFKNAVVYQIFPDRFCRGSDFEKRRQDSVRPEGWRGTKRLFTESFSDIPFYIKNEKGEVTRWPMFGGTLEGICEKLLYLKSLGISAVYLNPIFEASSSHKYDTADYTRIDPGFGDDESFKKLVTEAEKLGISLILDGVFSHTGADSVYFDKYGNYRSRGACQGKDSPYFDWYSFTEFPDKYDCWWGVSDLPCVDKKNTTYNDFIYGGDDSIVRRWLRAGARGWRLDVADELPDEFIQNLRGAMKFTRPDSVLIGEVWEDASNKISYGRRRKYLLGRELDSVMNYPFRSALTDFMLRKLSAFGLASRLMSLKENYPPENYKMALNLIGSHDRARIITVLGEVPEDLPESRKEFYKLSPEKYGLAKKRLKLLSLIQYTVLGVPCIYYGDEAGLEGCEDPFNRAPFPWDSPDLELTEHYRALAKLRAHSKLLLSGDFSPLGLSDNVFSFTRRGSNEEIVILINRSVSVLEKVSLNTKAGYVLELLSSEELLPQNGKLSLELLPLSSKVLYFMDNPPEYTELKRSAGVLCHISSVPARRADGASLQDIFDFIDFLARSGQKLWQVLPLNPAGKGSSPYLSPALFALDSVPKCKNDFSDDAYLEFCRNNNFWLDDYALYMALTDVYGGAWQKWPERERDRLDVDDLKNTHKASAEKYKRLQFLLERSWLRIKEYANDRSISIIGDIPIYASPGGADAWANREIFRLNEKGYAPLHAGVPPDCFSSLGQDWGNPLYDWEGNPDSVFLFWERRLRRAALLHDYIRLDHFRAFSAYFAIPEGKTPSDGEWLCGPGPDFLTEMRKRLGKFPVIAEDLGKLDASVCNLIKLSGSPGMNVWQFSASEMENMTKKSASHRIFYSGTHDNPTLLSFCADSFPDKSPESEAMAVVEKLYRSEAPWVIIPLQDLLLLSDDSRMNTPGIAEGNWKWRADGASLTADLSNRLKKLALDNKR